MKVVFMGTPHFAAPALNKLLESEHEVIAVYTMPPRPAGRGKEIVKSVIHGIAESNDIPIFTPKNFKDDNDFFQFANLKPDICVVAAYGVILPKRVLDLPKYGCINIHPSLLPRWRGAAPLQHTIMANDKESAICIMKMDVGMDTGDIILQEKFSVPQSMTAAELHDLTSNRGGEMVIDALKTIETGTATFIKQSEHGVTHARKIERQDEVLDFSIDVELVHAKIRTFSPRPGAYCKYKNENIKIIQADFEVAQHNHPYGLVIDDDLAIACKNGYLRPTLLQREGKKMIYRDAFLRGFKIPKGDKLD